TDLVTLRKTEAFPLHLLASKRPEEWIRVRELCLQIGVAPGDLRPNVFATWLTDPLGDATYTVIMFYDDESKWSMAAHYNRARLLGASPNQAVIPAEAAISASTCSRSPTAEL